LKFEIHVLGYLPDIMNKARKLGNSKRQNHKRLKEIREENKYFIM
jgi:hypothetical protein